MTIREANYAAPDYTDSLKDRVLQAVKDDSLEHLINELCLNLMSEKEMSLITKVLLLILEAKNPSLMTTCICVACGLNALIKGQSGEAIGRKYGMTRSNISVLVNKIRRELNLTNQNRTAKSKKACESYKLYNKEGRRKHYDNQ